MKKAIYIFWLILVIILFPVTVNAAGIEVKLNLEKQEYIVTSEEDAMPNTEIATIELKLNRQQINGDKQTKISLNNIELSDGEFKITSQKSVTINLKNNKTDSNIAQKVSDIKIIAGEKAINTTASQRNNEITLPNAGNSTWLVVIIVILILLMILFKFKSRKIKY